MKRLAPVAVTAAVSLLLGFALCLVLVVLPMKANSNSASDTLRLVEAEARAGADSGMVYQADSVADIARNVRQQLHAD